jgi:hypothetical protein
MSTTETTTPAEGAPLTGTKAEIEARYTGRTVHVLRGTTYHGRYTLTEVRLAGDWIQFTGTWHTDSHDVDRVTYSARPCDMFDTAVAARDEARARRKAARARRAEAGPRMMPATDGNMLAMLVGATKVRSR